LGGNLQVSVMKLMLTNDDGIDAPGLHALARAAQSLGEAVIVAPATHQSGCSHTVTWEKAIRVDARDAKSFAVHGTPADCTRLALLKLAPDTSWVLSGINHGGNLGADVHYSGTVAAVREAVLHGWPGIAVSHYQRRGFEFDWDRASGWVTPLLRDLMARPIKPGTFFNVNLPHLAAEAPDPEVVFCSLDPNPLPLSYSHEEDAGHLYDGDYQSRKRSRGMDVDVCFNGAIAVTPVSLF
jgi:5'-nucleotidase